MPRLNGTLPEATHPTANTGKMSKQDCEDHHHNLGPQHLRFIFPTVGILWYTDGV
jgi:hypothetical protein